MSLKEEAKKLHDEGMSFGKIADKLGISKSLAFKYCSIEINKLRCKQCGISITFTNGKKSRIFCSDQCRKKWWNSHNIFSENSKKEQKCPICGKVFYIPKYRKKTYCSINCYQKSRKGKNNGKA